MYYTASLFFRSEHDPIKMHPLWEERLVLIQALSEEEAITNAETLGRCEEHEYRNEAGELICWRFAKVERIFPLEKVELRQGLELFSRFLRSEEAESILHPFADE